MRANFWRLDNSPFLVVAAMELVSRIDEALVDVSMVCGLKLTGVLEFSCGGSEALLDLSRGGL